jgi:hypothetical protein
MSIYVFKNNQQSGPFEESQVRGWLASGQLSPNDMAVRQGETQWKPLSLLLSGVSNQQPVAAQFSPRTGGSPAAVSAFSQQSEPKKGAGKLFLALIGLFVLGIIGIGIAATTFMRKSKTTDPVVITKSGNTNNTSINSNNTNTTSPVPNYTELQGKVKELIALKPPVKLEKNPAFKGKVVVVEQRDKDNEYSLRMLPGDELPRYGLSSERLAANLAEIDTLVQILCGKGKEIGKFGPRMAYVPAYSNTCNVSVIDYRESKTIAQKVFVNAKKPAKIYVRDDQNEYILDPPTEDVEKFLSALAKE